MPEVYATLHKQDGIARIEFAQPATLNALSPQAIAQLSLLFKELAGDPSMQVVILTGSGKAFIAGADIKQMSQMSDVQAWQFAREGQELLNLLEELPQVTIAAVNGFALGGGCEVAMACDLIYAADSAIFGQPEVGLGIIPGFGGTVRLQQRLGLGAAKEWILRGFRIDAAKAMQQGLVQAVFPASALLDETLKIAKEIQGKSPHALMLGKRSLQFAASHPQAASLQYEAELFSQCFTHHDQKEGTSAFVEKRPPHWKIG